MCQRTLGNREKKRTKTYQKTLMVLNTPDIAGSQGQGLLFKFKLEKGSITVFLFLRKCIPDIAEDDG